MKTIISFFTACCLFANGTNAQNYFSIATDVSILRNFSPQQHFSAFGQTVQGNMHFSKKESAYAWVSYYTNGSFKNNQTALAKDSSISPYQLDYTIHSTLRYRQFSLGWKHYFKGSFDSENTWNLYGYAGYGLLLIRATNTYSQPFDTAQYSTTFYVNPGTGNFKRLTFDLGLGTEIPLGTFIYFYTEVRSCLPASDTPSPYLINNKNVPFAFALNGGIRILID